MVPTLSRTTENVCKHLKGGSLRPKNILVSKCPQALELVAELSSALCSAASQNLAAVSSLHSLAETMLLLALKLLGLISTNHRVHSFQVLILNIGREQPK